MKNDIILKELVLLILVSISSHPAFSDNIGGHEYVDLGLPSGTLWAKCNLGAKSEKDPGQYFAWGENKSKDGKLYTRASYKYHRQKTIVNQVKSIKYLLTKYNYDRTYGDVDKKIELDNSDDAVISQWGDLWCTPTSKQIYELVENCKWESFYENERLFVKVIGSNNNYIIFPIAGYYIENEANNSKGNYKSYIYNKGDYSYYWTKTLSTLAPNYAMAFQVGYSKYRATSIPRKMGVNIKAVVSKKGINQIISSTPDSYDEYAKEGESFSINNTFPFDIRTYYIMGQNEVNNNVADEEFYNKMLSKYNSLKVTPKMLTAQKEGKGTLANFLLGYCSYKGLGITQDKDKSLKWLREGSKKGDFRCTVMMFTLGLTDSRNHDDMSMLSNAAKQGYLPAEMMSLYLQSIKRPTRYFDRSIIGIFPSDGSDKLKKLEELKNKYAEAEYMYGKIYNDNSFIDRAATKGLSYAIYELAYEYDKQKKYSSAYQYVKAGTDVGIKFHQGFVNRVRICALVRSNNPDEVSTALKEAYNLGRYSFVISAYKNAEKRNCINGDAVAYYALSLRALGTKNKQEEKDCFNLLKDSAEGGSIIGMVGLAEAYEKGFGLDAIDMNSAFMWYKKAAQSGSEKAKKYLTNRNIKW